MKGNSRNTLWRKKETISMAFLKAQRKKETISMAFLKAQRKKEVIKEWREEIF